MKGIVGTCSNPDSTGSREDVVVWIHHIQADEVDCYRCQHNYNKRDGS